MKSKALSLSSNGEKENNPFCTYCQKSFANHSNLRHHIQIIHLKENKWNCIRCGKTCSSKSNLKVHFRTHIRVKPYACRYCDYSCMHHSSIKDHLTKNHSEQIHSTNEPGYIYNSQSVPEPDEFNSVDFNREKFIELSNQTNKSDMIDTSQNLALLFLSLWSFNLTHRSLISSKSNSNNRKSFDINDILDLSLSNKN